MSHRVHDHTSVLKLVETKWNLGALTYRDPGGPIPAPDAAFPARGSVDEERDAVPEARDLVLEERD